MNVTDKFTKALKAITNQENTFDIGVAVGILVREIQEDNEEYNKPGMTDFLVKYGNLHYISVEGCNLVLIVKYCSYEPLKFIDIATIEDIASGRKLLDQVEDLMKEWYSIPRKQDYCMVINNYTIPLEVRRSCGELYSTFTGHNYTNKELLESFGITGINDIIKHLNNILIISKQEETK